jgi:hypothetical protein
MHNSENSTEAALLYRQFSEAFTAEDDDAVRRIYRKLLNLGCPRAEIVEEAVRLASNRDGIRNRMQEQSEGANETEVPAGHDETAPRGTIPKILIPALPLSETLESGVGKTTNVRGAECTSADIPEFAQDELPDKTAGHKVYRESAFLYRHSLIPRAACAFGSVAIALLCALVVLHNPSTAEKATASVAPAALSKSANDPVVTGIPLGSSALSDLGKAVHSQGSAEARRETTKLPDAVDTPTRAPREPNARTTPDLATAARANTGVPSAAAGATLSSGDVAVLLTRGDSLFGTGDLVSSRLFYERAAAAGSGEAALRLGESYDPHFLEKTHLRGRGDVAAAIFWYERARELGVNEATILLSSIRSN